MRARFVVEVEFERREGLFATRDELISEIAVFLDDANPQELEGENGGIYEITTWEVDEEQK